MDRKRKLEEEVERTLSLLEEKDFLEFKDDLYGQIAPKMHKKRHKRKSYGANIYSKLIVLLPLLVLLNIFIFYLIFERNTDYKETRERVLIDSLSTNFYTIE